MTTEQTMKPMTKDISNQEQELVSGGRMKIVEMERREDIRGKAYGITRQELIAGAEFIKTCAKFNVKTRSWNLFPCLGPEA